MCTSYVYNYISNCLYWRWCVLKLHVTITIYTDLKKSVRYDWPQDFGIKNSAYRQSVILSWFSSYSSNRSFYIIVDNHLSNNAAGPSSVPQGGHLSLILFILFINDIGATFKFCKYLLSINDSTLLQCDLLEFTKYCDRKHFSDNPSKRYKVVSFNCQRNKPTRTYIINSFELHTSSNINDLDVVLSSDLTFNAHKL